MRVILSLMVLLAFQSQIFAQESAAEWIKVYFNMPAFQLGESNHNAINDEWDLPGTLIQLVDSATTSVDLCIYDLEYPPVAEALIRAKDRGVRVRLITDNHNRDDSRELDPIIWNMLGEVGIFSMDDDGDIFKNAFDITDFDLVNDGADMHNKFAVIDHLSATKNDDIVWTGSTNLTYTGAYNTNNVIVIKDAEVAEVYNQEFEQMWGGNGSEPNPEQARFHKDKVDVTQHIFDVGGTKVEVYFAPVNRDRTKPSISERLVTLIEEEVQSDINFQAFAFTPSIPLAKTIWSASENENIQLNGVIDPGFFSRYRNANQIWGSDEAQSGNRMVMPARETRKLHHKVLVLDANNPDSNDVAVVVTGSYNFSNNAELNNDENLVIIYSDEIAAQYFGDFSGAIERAKGTIQAPAPPIDPDKWYSVYSISDGSKFEIEVLPGFGYPVRFLGVDVPSLYAGKDSSDYFSGAAAEYLSNTLTGRRVRIYGADWSTPENFYGAYRAYVDVDFDGNVLPLNQLLIKNGYGEVSRYGNQHKDSVVAFKLYQQFADEQSNGFWRNPGKIGTKVARQKEAASDEIADVIFPININIADQATLQLLPGIGEVYAKRIIEYREQNGGFKKVEELKEIKGIGERRFERLRPVVTL